MFHRQDPTIDYDGYLFDRYLEQETEHYYELAAADAYEAYRDKMRFEAQFGYQFTLWELLA